MKKYTIFFTFQIENNLNIEVHKVYFSREHITIFLCNFNSFLKKNTALEILSEILDDGLLKQPTDPFASQEQKYV